MRRFAIVGFVLALFPVSAHAQPPGSTDNSPHKIQKVTVDSNVELEVLDWGGDGPPLIFLAGFGNAAHVFDKFAVRFTNKNHVYGITRRGFGTSSKPALTLDNYDPDRLGDDVLAVIEALKLDKPVLAGHSIAGQELSSIGSRHPDKVSGLIYLDAAWEYAFFNPKADTLNPYAAAMLRDLARLPSANRSEERKLIAEVQQNIPGLQRSLKKRSQELAGTPDLSPEKLRDPLKPIFAVMIGAERQYSKLSLPMLAIFAVPYECKSDCDTPRQRASDADDMAQFNFVKSSNPTARVISLPGADHFIFVSNAEEVEREMNAFFAQLH